MRSMDKVLLLVFTAILLIGSYSEINSKLDTAIEANPDSTALSIIRILYALCMVLIIVLATTYSMMYIIDLNK